MKYENIETVLEIICMFFYLTIDYLDRTRVLLWERYQNSTVTASCVDIKYNSSFMWSITLLWIRALIPFVT